MFKNSLMLLAGLLIFSLAGSTSVFADEDSPHCQYELRVRYNAIQKQLTEQYAEVGQDQRNQADAFWKKFSSDAKVDPAAIRAKLLLNK